MPSNDLAGQTAALQSEDLHPIQRGARMGIMSGANPLYPTVTAGGHEALGAELQRMGLRYENTQGHYGGVEPSYMIHNPTRDQMADLGRRYGQESIVYSDKGNHELLYTNGPEQGQCRHTTGFNYSTKAPSDYYTALPGPDGSPQGYFQLPFDFTSPTTKHPASTPQVAKAMVRFGSELRKRLEAYELQLIEMRSKELAKSYQQTAHHREPGVHEPSGQPHSEPGVHERPAKQVEEPQSTAQKSEDIEKVSPPGFSEDAMHKLKAKYGTESAMKIAWAAYGKHKKNSENKMSKKTTQDPREFAAALAKAIRKTVAKAETKAAEMARANGGSIKVMKDENGLIEAGESSGDGAGKGIDGSGEHATKAVSKKSEAGLIEAGESSADGAGKGVKGSGDHATAAVKKDEMGAIEAGESSGEAAGKGIDGSGEHATAAVKKMGQDGNVMQPPMPKPMKSPIASHLAKIRGAGMVKQEDMIDRTNEASPTKRMKEMGPTKGRKLPSDGIKKVPAKGSGGEVEKGKMKKGDFGMTDGGRGGGKPTATPAVSAPAPKQSAAGIRGTAIKAEMSAKPAGIPGAPKPPQAPGAKPTMHKSDLAKAGMSGMGGMPKDMHHAASQDSHKAQVTQTVPPATKVTPKPPEAYDAKLYMPSSAAPTAKPGFVSPVKQHLDKIRAAKPKASAGKLPIAPLNNVVAKKNELNANADCKKCGGKMDKAHSC